MFEYQGDCHASVSTGVAMTWFFDSLASPGSDDPGEIFAFNYFLGSSKRSGPSYTSSCVMPLSER